MTAATPPVLTCVSCAGLSLLANVVKCTITNDATPVTTATECVTGYVVYNGVC